MRHRRKSVRLGRKSAHRKELLASLVCNLIEEKRIKTTLAKAKLMRSLAEKMVTVGRVGTLEAKRRALSTLRQEKCVTKLLNEIVPQFVGRQGGYTRILKLGRRASDGSEMALVEWVGITPPDKKKKAPKADEPKKAEKT
jgi:large subunit ribosomal protein L17